MRPKPPRAKGDGQSPRPGSDGDTTISNVLLQTGQGDWAVARNFRQGRERVKQTRESPGPPGLLRQPGLEPPDWKQLQPEKPSHRAAVELLRPPFLSSLARCLLSLWRPPSGRAPAFQAGVPEGKPLSS